MTSGGWLGDPKETINDGWMTDACASSVHTHANAISEHAYVMQQLRTAANEARAVKQAVRVAFTVAGCTVWVRP